MDKNTDNQEPKSRTMNLRINNDLYQDLQKIAKVNQRSLNKQVNYILKSFVEKLYQQD